MTTVQKITEQQLIELLSDLKDPIDAVIRYTTEPKLASVKLTAPYSGSTKEVVAECVIKVDYEQQVNAQRRVEGLRPAFSAGPRRWGIRIPGTPFIGYSKVPGKEIWYLEGMLQRVISTRYFDMYGDEVPFEKIEPYLKPIYSESRNQRTEAEVAMRTYALSSINEITIGDTTYAVVHR